jgi:hypothetical protein
VANRSTSRTVSAGGSQPVANEPLGDRSVSEQLEIQLSGRISIAESIRSVYRPLVVGVTAYGGVVELANAINKSHGEVSLRLRREQDDKGTLQRAFHDYVGVLGTHSQAREAYLFGLCDEWGYKHPEPRTAPTERELLASLLGALDGESGQAIKERAAKLGGFDARSFRR